MKVGEFEPEYVGKMQFYLSVLDDTVRLPEEQPSIRIILCKSKDKVVVEYALKERLCVMRTCRAAKQRGTTDWNRHMAINTPYADWFIRLSI
ncbi:PDDEXK nuclease domain-containing protein [Acidisarcina polymorpha]|uniref:PDDEXK nuclease domain-containing protein n=1 Tax=Acidisarcina polymorpha TaxID=2211140 RepID=UPI0039C8A9D5